MQDHIEKVAALRAFVREQNIMETTSIIDTEPTIDFSYIEDLNVISSYSDLMSDTIITKFEGGHILIERY